MELIIVLLQNYSPPGIIKHNYINKINAYNKQQEKSQLINKIYNDLLQKLPVLNDYMYYYDNTNIAINESSTQDLINKIINNNEDVIIFIHHKKGSAFGRYYLYVYSVIVQ